MIGVIDYKAGNAPSVLNALLKIGAQAKLVPVSYTHLDVYKRQDICRRCPMKPPVTES